MSLVFAVAVLLVVNAVAISTLLFVRRRAPEGSFFTDGDRASGVFGVLSTGFAIFAGFVVFLAFTNYDDSRAGAETEALAVVQLFETAQFLPDEGRIRLSGEITCYGRSVVHQEWPEMEDGTVGAINPWAIEMFESLKTVSTNSPEEEAAYGKWLDLTSEREQARRDRTHGAAGITPASVWLVLWTAAAVIFGFMLFFADSAEMKRSQAMLMGSATTILVLTLLVIKALDNPYASGIGSLKPVAMERALGTLDKAREVIGADEPIPCDLQGTKL